MTWWKWFLLGVFTGWLTVLAAFVIMWWRLTRFSGETSREAIHRDVREVRASIRRRYPA